MSIFPMLYFLESWPQYSKTINYQIAPIDMDTCFHWIFCGIDWGCGCETNITNGEINEMVFDKFEEEKQDKKLGVQQSIVNNTTLKSIIMVRL